MKVSFFRCAVFVTLSMIGNIAFADCERPTIDVKQIETLPNQLTVKDLTQRFGYGCLGGMTAMTYQYQLADGSLIWFWLRNKPERAFVRVGKGEAEDIEVVFAVRVPQDGESNDTVIWPKSKMTRTSSELMREAYFEN